MNAEKPEIPPILVNQFRTAMHAFEVSSGAPAAREMGGSLNVRSDGPGKGAVFTLELPCDPGKINATLQIRRGTSAAPGTRLRLWLGWLFLSAALGAAAEVAVIIKLLLRARTNS